MKRRWLVALALLGFAGTLVWTAPAAVLWHWLAPDGLALSLDGLEGSLGRGRVAAVSRGDKPLAGPLQWRLQPGWLLLAKASVALESEGELSGRGHLRVSPLGGVTVSDLELGGDLPALLRNSGYGYLPIDGRFSLNLDRLELSDRLPSYIDGQLDLRKLQWQFGRTALALGSFRADFSSEARQQRAVIRSVDGPLELSGEGSLDADGAYDLHLQMRARPGAEPQLQNLLRGLGRPDNQGYYHFRTRGSLSP